MKKILYLDDDESLCFLMAEIFQESGPAEVVTVNSFSELQKQEANIQDFDIIFLDVNLGDKVPNGLDAFDWLMEKKFNKKVVFFTGHAHSYPLVQKALNNSNVFVLEKPASIEEIDRYINA